ncbi:Putative FMN hydrolase; 5-Amino-6-(5'-phosphoribitylamino)uracil phosphatase [hydrothermal vent metagenome]|uniref:FMN hydrolase 5-Amino-6-(5'-phosphoribitylamino)uracil phosphatase n=1 Tax=hydrothermal vent metagenome TaxID=652676 RepID=A0A3B1ABQ2_9ZZZZ
MQTQQFKVITFDLDDTLWECMPVIERAELKLRKWLEINFPLITSKYSSKDCIKFREKVSARHPEHAYDFTFLRKKQLYHVALESGYNTKIAQNISDQGFHIFITERSNVKLYDDVIPSFNKLVQHFQLGALTNGNVDLSKTKLDNYFNFSLNAITAGYLKPDYRFFKQACKLATVDASEILHIGDHPIHDINGAKNAGMEAIWLNRNNNVWPDLPRPNKIIYSLSELPNLLLNC